MTRHIVFIMCILVSLATLAQKNKKPNYLRRAAAEPETWFTYGGKKNGTRIKSAELQTATIKTGDKLEGVTVIGIEVQIKRKDGSEEKFTSESLEIPEQAKDQMSGLMKGDKVILILKVKNRSTQIINTLPPHKYSVTG